MCPCLHRTRPSSGTRLSSARDGIRSAPFDSRRGPASHASSTVSTRRGTGRNAMLATEVIRIQFSDLAVQQLVHGVKRLGLRGAAVGASVAGDEFSDRKFYRFWAKA